MEKRNYVRRRAEDAARLLPFLGGILLLLPILRNPIATPEHETGAGVLYVFAVWVMLIVIAARISFALSDRQTDEKGRKPHEKEHE
nr:hypothetical protein [Cochlodiniinecator piscidefendens]